MKCVYKYCKCGDLEEIEAIETKSGFYHLRCFEKREAKSKIFNEFCKYVSNDENGLFIKKKISDYIDKEEIEPLYALFVIHNIVQHKRRLNSIWGFKKYLESSLMKNKYQDFLNKYKTIKVTCEEGHIKYIKEEKEGWGDMFG